MTQQNTITTIRAALDEMAAEDLSEVSNRLLSALGYRSKRLLDGQTGNVSDFIAAFSADNTDTRSEQNFRDQAREVRILFQFTNTEIAATTQQTLFDAESFSAGNSRSFLFAAVELMADSYPRGQYVSFTREINKRFNRIPAVVVFRTANGRVTLAFVNRRPSKIRADRQVLGSVSLIREIDAANPHRAHLDILAELSLDVRLKWMDDHGKPHNFDGLLDAWLAALDTEELNKRFYRELFAWFKRAVATARFPMKETVTLSAEQHVIRLITRLMFVWFIKEKGLVADELFIENHVGQLLKDYDPGDGDSYYRAVLQNLFFATLNTEINHREFSSGNNSTHREFSYYRYLKEMTNPDELQALFDQTPFINGGLFDCLDSFESTNKGGYRIDCFSDVHHGKLSIPNRLFFSQDADGDKPGLIDLFNRYRFTVEENTPVEKEVALDPELLGKVFENLLATYNPETQETAKKQTGSYYTPRVVVDYMVEEALVAALSQNCQPTDGDPKCWQKRLRYLLDYADAFNDAHDLFDADETAGLVHAIAELKVLDPAVGSGAFPMGILHKLTLALKRLDPHNEHWKELQKARAAKRAAAAFDTPTQQERDAELDEISEAFERYRDSDFGRKLYLMQNSIFGVDIQPIACQIAKLRFFISLAIEQEPNRNVENFGIKPLPNLETRFITADTLLHLKTASQLDLFRQQIETLKTRLAENRERHFHATTRRQKLACKDTDRTLRQELADVLRDAGLPEDDAGEIARWDPYDQNTKAGWFDTEYMFGNREGFDVVIGNPPYMQLQKNSGELGRRYESTGYETFARTGDLYQLFYEKGCQLLKPRHGLLAYITSNSWLKAEYGKGTRRYFAERHTPLHLLEMGKDIFENTIVDTNVLLLREGNGDKANQVITAVDMDQLSAKDFPPDAGLWGQIRLDGEKPWSILSPLEQRVMDKMQEIGTPLKDWDVRINYGIKTGYNDAFIIDAVTRQRLIAENPNSADIIKPILRGRDIQRYRAQWAGQYLIATHNGYANVLAVDIDDYPAIRKHLDGFYRQLERRQDKGWTPYNLRNCAYHEEFSKEKLFWMDMSPEGRFAFSESETYCNDKGFIMTGEFLKYLCAILNSTIITWFIKNTALTTGVGSLLQNF